MDLEHVLYEKADGRAARHDHGQPPRQAERAEPRGRGGHPRGVRPREDGPGLRRRDPDRRGPEGVRRRRRHRRAREAWTCSARRRSSHAGQAALAAIENLGKPVIAMINGYAFGGGPRDRARVPPAHDGRRARRSVCPRSASGIFPGFGGTQRLPRVVGRGRALEMILTGDPIDAETALRYGLVNRVAPADELRAVTEKLARRHPHARPARRRHRARVRPARHRDLDRRRAADRGRHVRPRCIHDRTCARGSTRSSRSASRTSRGSEPERDEQRPERPTRASCPARPRSRSPSTPGKRVLFLTKDPELIRRQLAGDLDLAMDDVDLEDLLDDINTDAMTPAWVCFRPPARGHRARRLRRARSSTGSALFATRRADATATSRSSSRASARASAPRARRPSQAEKWSRDPHRGRRVVRADPRAQQHQPGRPDGRPRRCCARLQAGESVPLDEFTARATTRSRALIVERGGLFPFATRARRAATSTVPPPRHGARAR